jgi:predicted  nucleic acid-binding Zn-ribbon protein
MKEFEKKSSPSREGFSKFLPASMSDTSSRRRLTEYEIQVQDLQAYIRSLEAETVHLRKKLEDSPKEFMIVENKLREANRQLVQAFNQNEKLVNALYESREQITALKEEVDKLCAPPSTYGVYLSVNEDGTVNILSQGRKVKVNLHPSINAETLKPGQELILNEGLSSSRPRATRSRATSSSSRSSSTSSGRWSRSGRTRKRSVSSPIPSAP